MLCIYVVRPLLNGKAMQNIIVLTSGLSGSSVVTHLLSRAGYWSGHSTCVKSDYNTHENSRLVDLNEQLLRCLDYDQDYSKVVNIDKIADAAELVNTLDLTPFKAFIDECSNQSPWIWKDPRLWVTMSFWIQLLDKNSFIVVFVDRSVCQRWISELLRKNVQSFSYCKQYNAEIEGAIKQLVFTHELRSCNVLFDDLIEQPEVTLTMINQSLSSSLNMDDLKAVYSKPLYKKPHGIKNASLAALIYLKNFWVRLK